MLSARGVSGREIALRLDLTPEHVSVIRARFRDEGVAGLHERPKSGRTDHAVAPATVEKIVQLAMSPPPAGRSRSTHSTAEVRSWLAANPLVHFHYTPTSASWLNQVEGFFGILGKQSLGRTDFRSKRALRDHLDAYMRAWNKSPTPFAWTKPADAIIKSHRRMLKRISTAVH